MFFSRILDKELGFIPTIEFCAGVEIYVTDLDVSKH